MYLHVTTYRLGMQEETERERDWALANDQVINDQTARTIASWWHSPRQAAIVALSHGLPFDSDRLREEIAHEIEDQADARALLDWVDAAEIFGLEG